MDPNYKLPCCLNVAKLPPRAPSPRLNRDNNVSTTPRYSPRRFHGVRDLHEEPTFVDSQIEPNGPDEINLSQSEKPVAEDEALPTSQISAFQHEIEF